MALFQQSSLTFAQAKTKIARAASAEADSDMLVKAGDALEAAFQTWNNERHWNFLRDSAIVSTIGGIAVTGCATTDGSASVLIAGQLVFTSQEGFLIVGPGIPPETYIVTVNYAFPDTTITLSVPATATGTVTLTSYKRDFAAPSNFKYIYNVRNTTTGVKLAPVDSRLLDTILPNQDTVGEPFVYDLHPMGEEGKIRFYPYPNTAYTILIKYYRRMTVPSVDGTALDLPIDFEWGVLAEAKAIFLAEKGGYDALADMWAGRARRALARAANSDNKHPDAQTSFLPASLGAGYGYAAETDATADMDR